MENTELEYAKKWWDKLSDSTKQKIMNFYGKLINFKFATEEMVLEFFRKEVLEKQSDSEKLLTAEEFFRNSYSSHYHSTERVAYLNDVYNAMDDYAKYHTEYHLRKQAEDSVKLIDFEFNDLLGNKEYTSALEISKTNRLIKDSILTASENYLKKL